jgi:hypothetical protein
MTPAALTPAAQDATKRRKPAATRTSSARSAGHRGPARAAAAPRRVSGPVTGTPRPRRVSGPARTGTSPRRVTPRPGAPAISFPRPAVLAARAGVFVRTLPDHRLLDRVVRGRSWIPILGLLLTGIVAMQVETLRLSASTGRSLERVTALQSLNQQLRDNVAVLGDDQRIERLAAGMNMVMPGPTQVRFLASHGGSVGRALGSIHAPDATTFLAALPSATTTATPTGAGSTSASTASTAATAASPAGTPAVAATVPTSSGVATGATATATGAAPASAAVTTTAPSATNTGVSSTGSSATGQSGAPATVTPPAPAATTPNGAAGVPSGG